MGAIRVTPGLIVQRTLTNLSAQTRRILRLQEQFASSLRVNRPSDDPIDARAAINIRASIGEHEQFQSNISDSQPFLAETDTTLQSLVDVLQRVRELTLQGANTTVSQAQRGQILLEVDQLLETLVVTANHQTNGRFIYAGTETLAAPFRVTRNAFGQISSVIYEGNANLIETEISSGSRVAINVPGSEVFQGNVDIFGALIAIREDLRASTPAAINNLNTIRLDALDDSVEQLLLSVARVGAVQNRVDRVSADLDDFILQLRGVLSDKIDADFADTIVQFNAQSNAFQAALNASARVIQPSLLDFVR